MKTKSFFLVSIALAFLLFACNQSKNYKEAIAEQGAALDSTANKFISSSAAVEKGKDSTRKFIRTADMKFKVKSVVNATYEIENITNKLGGFVIFTNLTSSINNTTSTTVSADSSLETTYFTVVNSITLRVPNTKLDTTLKSIATLIDYLDYRIIKADDVALNIYANKLTQNRATKYEQRLAIAIDNKGKKLNETSNAEELLSSKQEQADNAKISNLTLQDQIKFSTISLNIYQRQSIKRELISNYKNIEQFTPSFSNRFLDALKSGWEILQSIIIFFAQMWSFFLTAFILFIIYKRFGHKLKK
jgi:hypothetical protein